MSSSTCVNLLGHVEPEQIFDFIRKNFDSNAKFYSPRKFSFDGLASDYDFIKEIYDDTNKATSFFIFFLFYFVNPLTNKYIRYNI